VIEGEGLGGFARRCSLNALIVNRFPAAPRGITRAGFLIGSCGRKPRTAIWICKAVDGKEKAIRMALRFWLCAVITAISALVTASFSVTGLIGPSGGDAFARYAASRSIALLVAVLCCMALRSRKGIAALALVMSLVQGFDGLIGALAHALRRRPGTSRAM
jgi:hypothetical protein